MAEEIINKVSESQLVQIDLDDYYFNDEVMEYDIAQNLFQGLILREKEFRDFLKNYDWTPYENQKVSIICSADAIIPNWAYMLLASHFEKVNAECFFGEKDLFREKMMLDAVRKIDLKTFHNKPVLLKGCGNVDLSPDIYVQIVHILQPVAKSIMFGEACSTVPVFKKKLN
jgi:hypothetical protein